MKKLLYIIAIFMVFTLTACSHQPKEEQVNPENISKKETAPKDKITKDVFTDDFGEQLEVAVNETQNTVIVRLNGKTYELKKNHELPEYTAADADYQYSDVRGEITFLRKGYNIVLFHHKKNKISSGAKMASY